MIVIQSVSLLTVTCERNDTVTNSTSVSTKQDPLITSVYSSAKYKGALTSYLMKTSSEEFTVASSSIQTTTIIQSITRHNRDIIQTTIDITESTNDGTQHTINITQSTIDDKQGTIDITKSTVDIVQSTSNIIESTVNTNQSIADVSGNNSSIAITMLVTVGLLLVIAIFLIMFISFSIIIIIKRRHKLKLGK